MPKLDVPCDYELLAFAKIDGDSAIVLCRIHNNRATPFVTWRLYMHPSRGEPANGYPCNHGHYCRDMHDGWNSFLERAKLNPFDVKAHALV